MVTTAMAEQEDKLPEKPPRDSKLPLGVEPNNGTAELQEAARRFIDFMFGEVDLNESSREEQGEPITEDGKPVPPPESGE